MATMMRVIEGEPDLAGLHPMVSDALGGGLSPNPNVRPSPSLIVAHLMSAVGWAPGELDYVTVNWAQLLDTGERTQMVNSDPQEIAAPPEWDEITSRPDAAGARPVTYPVHPRRDPSEFTAANDHTEQVDTESVSGETTSGTRTPRKRPGTMRPRRVATRTGMNLATSPGKSPTRMIRSGRNPTRTTRATRAGTKLTTRIRAGLVQNPRTRPARCSPTVREATPGSRADTVLLRPRSPVPRTPTVTRARLRFRGNGTVGQTHPHGRSATRPGGPTSDPRAGVRVRASNAGQPPAWQARGQQYPNRTDASSASGSAWVSGGVLLLTLAALPLIFGLSGTLIVGVALTPAGLSVPWTGG